MEKAEGNYSPCLKEISFLLTGAFQWATLFLSNRSWGSYL